jgi:hypothetical protein
MMGILLCVGFASLVLVNVVGARFDCEYKEKRTDPKE